MVKNKRFIMGILLIMFLIISNHTICFGISYNQFKPNINKGESTEFITKISDVMGTLTIIGTILTVVLLAIMGFMNILGSASEKADFQVRYTGFLIGAILITSISIVARLIISIAERLNV